jgi:hypothetical protein
MMTYTHTQLDWSIEGSGAEWTAIDGRLQRPHVDDCDRIIAYGFESREQAAKYIAEALHGCRVTMH